MRIDRLSYSGTVDFPKIISIIYIDVVAKSLSDSTRKRRPQKVR